MTSKKYLVCPGEVESRTDGDFHFITTSDLIRLYCVDPADCEVQPRRGQQFNEKDFIVLKPRYDGDYPIFSTKQPPTK